MANTKVERIRRRKVRVRSRFSGTKACPRLSVHKTVRHIYGQFVDDEHGVTMAQFSSSSIKPSEAKGKTKTEIAEIVGSGLSELAKSLKVKKIVFDRGSNKYHGRVKALAEAVRKGGIEF